MAVSLREYPVISGENAKRFLQRENENKDKISKLLEKLKKRNSKLPRELIPPELNLPTYPKVKE